MKVLIVEDEILERKALIHLMKTEFEQVSIVPVSYTHLKMPTTSRVVLSGGGG